MTHVQAAVTFTLWSSGFAFLSNVRARHCGDYFDRGTLIVFVAVTAALISVVGVVPSSGAVIAMACAVVSAATDISSGYIYDMVTYTAAIAMLAFAICDSTVPAASLGAATALAVSGILHIWKNGRGLGMGDVKLFAIAGAASSVLPSLLILGASFVVGAAVIGIALVARRLHWADRVAFAPYIAIVTVVVFLGIA